MCFLRHKLTHTRGRLWAALCVCRPDRTAGLALLLALVLAGAAGAADPPARPLLQMIAWVGEEERLPAGVRDLLQGFEQSQPVARVNLIYDRWPQAQPRLKYWTGSLREYAPDLTIIRDVWLPRYAASLLPLDDVIGTADLASLVPTVTDRGRLGGKLLGVPWRLSARALYYRADLLAEAGLAPPHTLADLAAAARKLTKPGQVWGLGLPGAAGGDGAETFLSLLAACGGRPVDEAGHLALGTPEAQRVLQWWLDLAQAGALAPEALSWTEADLQAAFAAGRVAMVPGEPDFGAALSRQQTSGKYAVTAMPTDKGGANLVSCDLLVALAGTKHPRECASFLRFVAGAGGQRALWLMGGLPTCRPQVAEGRQDPRLAPYLDQLETARGWPLEQSEAVLRVVDRALWLSLSGRADAAGALAAAVGAESAREQ